MLITSGVLRVKLRRSVTVNVVIGAAEWKSEGGWVELGRSFPDLIRPLSIFHSSASVAPIAILFHVHFLIAQRF